MSDYYSINDRLSNSTFKRFRHCSALAYAELTGEEVRAESPELEIGKYVDAMVFNDPEPTLGPSLFKKNGELYKQHEYLNTIVSDIKEDGMFMGYLSGELQKEIMFDWNGIPWKAKLDCIPNLHKNMVVDLKTAAKIDQWLYSPRFGGKVPFYYEKGYDIQGAVYKKATGLDRFMLAIATKQNPCGRYLIEIPELQLKIATDYILENQEKVWKQMKGEDIEYCSKSDCKYCRKRRETTIVVADVFAKDKEMPF